MALSSPPISQFDPSQEQDAPEIPRQVHRPRRSAAARRKQQQRANYRTTEKLLKEFACLQHRGCSPTILGQALADSLCQIKAKTGTERETRHTMRQHSGMPTCRHWLQHKCTFGDRCKFSHSSHMDNYHAVETTAPSGDSEETNAPMDCPSETNCPNGLPKWTAQVDEHAVGSSSGDNQEPCRYGHTEMDNRVMRDWNLARLEPCPTGAEHEQPQHSNEHTTAQHEHEQPQLGDHEHEQPQKQDSDTDVDDESDTEPITWSHVESAVRKVVHNHGAQIQLHDLRGLVEAELQIPHNALRECLRELKTMLLQARREADT